MIARDTGPPTDTRTCHVRCKVCLGDGRSQYGLGTLGFVTRSVRASYQATRCYHKCPPTKLCGRRPALRTAMLAIAAAAANLVAPELTISEDSSRILMISAREHRVYSRCASTLPTRGGWPSALCAVTPHFLAPACSGGIRSTIGRSRLTAERWRTQCGRTCSCRTKGRVCSCSA